MALLTTLGLPGMFIAAFLAATILPLGSEIVFSALLLSDIPQLALWLSATGGNVAGSVVNYFIGWWGGEWLARKRPDHQPVLRRAQAHFQRYGQFSLLFAWLPVIGDPLTVVAGMLRTRIWVFILLVTVGKGARYAGLIWLFNSAT